MKRTEEMMYAAIANIRLGYDVDGDGKKRSKPRHITESDLAAEVLACLKERGELFQSAGTAYYLDNEMHELMAIPGQDWDYFLQHNWGFISGQSDTKLICSSIRTICHKSPERTIYRDSYMAPDFSAVYLLCAPNRMIKVTASGIHACPIGTDGVLLKADDIAPFPVGLEQHLSDLQPLIGNTCLMPISDAPTSLLTTRWALNAALTPEQSQWYHLGRIVFFGAASRYSLWPICLTTGEQGSGKSTAAEAFLSIRAGKIDTLQAIPHKEETLNTSITTRSIVAYDNIDNINDEDVSNKLCQVATGAKIDMRVLYTTNTRISLEVRNHAYLNARNNPFDRSDVMRRILHLETEAPEAATTQPKDQLLARILESRPQVIAELILRTRNVLLAHQQYASKTFCRVSQMTEYEQFTLVCSEYERNLDFALTAWQAYANQARKTISSSNTAVFAIRLWLGADISNVNREVRSEVLQSECAGIYADVAQKLPYENVAKFSTALGKNKESLGILGYKNRHTRTGNLVSFSPSSEELDSCTSLYRELLASVAKREPGNAWGHGQSARDKLLSMQSKKTQDAEAERRKAMEIATLEALSQ